MNAVSEKPGLMELVGLATCTSNLVSVEDRERAVDRVAALGAAGLALRHEKSRIAGDRNEIEVQLAPLLWRLWAGDGAHFEPYIAAGFAQWLSGKGSVNGFVPNDPDPIGTINRLATRIVHESAHCRCVRCKGSGQLEITAKGLVTPMGRGARNARYMHCRTCGGSGRAIMSPGVRAAAIGVSTSLFKERHMERHFDAGHAWLHAIAARLNRHVQLKLGRGKIAPQ